MVKRIRFLAMDVDGTMTDGSINISSNGELFKTFNVQDGYAIKKTLRTIGIVPIIITGRESKIVDIRAADLGIDEVHQGVSDKAAVIRKLCVKYKSDPSEFAYIGDDLNDIPAMEIAGLSFAPSDAIPEVASCVDVILPSPGGRGAVRDCINYLKSHCEVITQ
jgi:3-deoxy-D-manno-octulosonate 8-phosphate phosphatase (KDO 8-P phosphatase)